MIPHLLQLATVAIAAIYLAGWRVGLSRKGVQSWDSLIARLEPNWSGRELSAHFPVKEGLDITPEETWQRRRGLRCLRAMYRNAAVKLAKAGYAARNSDSVDPVRLAAIRSDATQIRMAVLAALAHSVFNQASETVKMNAFQIASMYTGMASRMAQLIQQNAAVMVPDFVAAI